MTVTVDDVRECGVKLSSRPCELDPLPGYIKRNALDTLLPFITKIINTSLQSGQMPSHLKVAKLHPLLKKAFSGSYPVETIAPFLIFLSSAKQLRSLLQSN